MFRVSSGTVINLRVLRALYSVASKKSSAEKKPALDARLSENCEEETTANAQLERHATSLGRTRGRAELFKDQKNKTTS